MNTNDFVDKLKQSLGDNLQCVLAYGSTVRGDHAPGFSDTNLLVVTSRLDAATLKNLFEPIRQWVANKNPPPLLFTREQLKNSLDVFPIEFSEMLAHHRVVFGQTPFLGVVVGKSHLRWQLEYELRVKLIRVRQLFLENAKEPTVLEPLMAKAVSSVSALMRAILLLAGREVPQQQADVWRETGLLTPIDQDALAKITAVRVQAKKKPFTNAETEDLFGRLLSTIESLIQFVDGFKK